MSPGGERGLDLVEKGTRNDGWANERHPEDDDRIDHRRCWLTHSMLSMLSPI